MARCHSLLQHTTRPRLQSYMFESSVSAFEDNPGWYRVDKNDLGTFHHVGQSKLLPFPALCQREIST